MRGAAGRARPGRARDRRGHDRDERHRDRTGRIGRAADGGPPMAHYAVPCWPILDVVGNPATWHDPARSRRGRGRRVLFGPAASMPIIPKCGAAWGRVACPCAPPRGGGSPTWRRAGRVVGGGAGRRGLYCCGTAAGGYHIGGEAHGAGKRRPTIGDGSGDNSAMRDETESSTQLWQRASSSEVSVSVTGGLLNANKRKQELHSKKNSVGFKNSSFVTCQIGRCSSTPYVELSGMGAIPRHFRPRTGAGIRGTCRQMSRRQHRVARHRHP